MFVALHTSTQCAERGWFFRLPALLKDVADSKIYFEKYYIFKNLPSFPSFVRLQSFLIPKMHLCCVRNACDERAYSCRGIVGEAGSRRIHCNFALHQLSTLFQKFARAQWWKEGKTIKKWSLSSLLWFTSTCRSRNFFFSTCLWTRAAANLMYMVGIFIPL